MRRGVLHLVVGPSGAGKDTLIDAARTARPDILFPRRVVTRRVLTRNGAAIGEDHDELGWTDFEAAEAAGAFALSWRAHELAYGVPRTALAPLAEGRHVIMNVSRSVLAPARASFAPVRILSVTAPLSVLTERLIARGRETPASITARLDRAPVGRPSGADVVDIDNGGALEDAKRAFLAALAPPETAGLGGERAT